MHPELVEALLRPQAYPPEERPERVELVEIHISWLFLTGGYVYKVKKPLDLGFLDFTTLERRRSFCEQEVSLNRRLSPEVYLGVVEIHLGPQGYAVEGSGELVEYAVKMRQLPGDRALRELLRHGDASPEMVPRLAHKVWEFHTGAETGPEITRLGGLEAVRANMEENFHQTREFIGQTIPQRVFDRIRAFCEPFVEVRQDLFQRRQQEGRVRDCHGDLHTSNIFLLNGDVSIIDCIEFNQRFRYSDVASDLAFLAMDIDYCDEPGLSRLLVDTYIEASGDTGLRETLDFYKCYRAYVRGKVNSFRLRDQELPAEEKAAVASKARRYFDLAASYTPDLPPFLLIIAGLMGTGKSFVAKSLAGCLKTKVLSSDVLRKELAGVPSMERHHEAWGTGLYDEEQSDATYQELHRRARTRLEAGRSTILDASYRSREWRQGARQVASECGVPFLAVECVAPEEVLRQRLEARVRRPGVPSDGRWEIFHQQREAFEPVTEIPGEEHLVLETGGSREETRATAQKEVFAWLLRVTGPEDGLRSVNTDLGVHVQV